MIRMPSPSFAVRTPSALLFLALTALVPTPATAQDLVLTRANVVDVAAGAIIEGATVTVRDGVIQSVDAGGGAPSPGARVVDLEGRYLAPGLMDAHVHIGSEADARRALFTGVTTMRSMGAGHYADVGMRELQRDGYATTPEYLAAGYHVRPQMAEGFFQDHPELGALDGGSVNTVDAVRSVVRALLSRDVDFIKTNATERAGLPDTDPRKQLFGEAEIRVMVEEADRAGILGVAAHAHGDEGGRAAVAAGVRSIEHGTYASESTLRLMLERGTWLVPTLSSVLSFGQPGDYADPRIFLRGQHLAPRRVEMVRRAYALGIPIVVGVDTSYGAESTARVARAVAFMVEELSFDPLYALQAATSRSAELLGVAGQTGRVGEGMEADLLVIDSNPLERVRALQDPLLIISNGHVVTNRLPFAKPGR